MIKRLMLIIVLTIPAFLALLQPGYYNMHDDMQPIRQLELEKCFKDGQIPCRWVPDLGYGYGYPLFNFYPPLPYFVGEAFRLVGVSFLWSIKLTAVAQVLFSTIAMYLLASSIFGFLPGLTAAVFYAYAPYHAVNIYIRGAMNEAWAAVFFPLVFYFVKRLIEKPNLSSVIMFSLSIAGIFLSHNPMVMIFAPFAVLWALFWLFKYKKNFFRKILLLSFSGIFSVLLSAFFTLPVIFESSLVQIDSMFSNYYSYIAHFTTLKQLFLTPYWGNGPSVWGPLDGMPFMIGYLHWLLPLFILGLIIFSLLKTRKHNFYLYLTLFLVLSSFLTAFLTHERSGFLWRLLTPIQKIQFPWRFLNLTVFFASLSVSSLGYLFSHLKIKLNETLLFSLLILSVIALNLNYFRPLVSGPITDDQKFKGSWVNLVTASIYDYLPKTARIAARGPAKEAVDEITPANSATISNIKHGTDWLSFTATGKDTATLTIAQLYFPDFKITVDQNNFPFTVEPELGRMVITLPPGIHQVSLKLHNTPIRVLGNTISFLAWIIVFFYFLTRLWPLPRRLKILN
ncbi:YfhO family protein [Patescibacteria group bacterium]|nr:YfhO family protein [Patescibacteria group bacterium]